jgi:hypothetical protein
LLDLIFGREPSGAGGESAHDGGATCDDGKQRRVPVDPATLIATMSAGLRLLDQFRDLTLKVLARDRQNPSVHAEPRSGELIVKSGELIVERDGQVVAAVHSTHVSVSAWDEIRLKSLGTKIEKNWVIYCAIDQELPGVSVDEKIRLNLRLHEIQNELCRDFQEMLSLYERTTGLPLREHYALDSVCGQS